MRNYAPNILASSPSAPEELLAILRSAWQWCQGIEVVTTRFRAPSFALLLNQGPWFDKGAEQIFLKPPTSWNNFRVLPRISKSSRKQCEGSLRSMPDRLTVFPPNTPTYWLNCRNNSHFPVDLCTQTNCCLLNFAQGSQDTMMFLHTQTCLLSCYCSECILLLFLLIHFNKQPTFRWLHSPLVFFESTI